MYSPRVVLVLTGMILTGAFRSVAVKVFFQLGARDPLFVTLLYLLGQGLSLVVHWVNVRLSSSGRGGYQMVSPGEAPANCADGAAEWTGPDCHVELVPGSGDASAPLPSDRGAGGSESSGGMMDVPPSAAGARDGPESRAVAGDGTAAAQESSEEMMKVSLSTGRTRDVEPQSKIVAGEGERRRRSLSDAFVDNPTQEVESLDGTVGDDANCEGARAGVPLVGALDKESPLLEAVVLPSAAAPEKLSGAAVGCDCHRQENGACGRPDEDAAPAAPPPPPPKVRTHKRRGSDTGLTAESARAVAWVHRIPWFLKPAIPGFFNLCNSAMRWGSLVFVAASTAEMLISGLELVLSVVAARLIRRRMVSGMRWGGTSVVALGIVLVGLADVVEEEQEKNDRDGGPSPRELLFGNLLILNQCLFSVLQDLAEEIFLQEADFPATLLLGMEGAFGLFFGIPIYFGLAAQLGEAPSETFDALLSSPSKIVYCVLLVFLFTATGILNIVATEVTSSMTRNVWKNFRTVLVWVICLLIFYFGGNKTLGEEWVMPGSLFVLGGFFVMVLGVYIYYTGGDQSSILSLWLRFRSRWTSLPVVTDYVR